jgi:tetratricopeptide (TPR) repeat protein
MKTRLLLCCVLALLAGCRTPSATRKPPPDPADVKVRLYAEALTARDAGDLATAKARLQALLELSPGDAGVQRLLALVEAALSAPPPPAPAASSLPLPAPEVRAAPVSPVATVPVPAAAATSPRTTPTGSVIVRTLPGPATPPVGSAPAPALMPTVVEEPVPNAAPRPPPDPRTQALVRVEAIGAALAAAPEEARTEKLMAYIQAQRALAAEYAREGNYIVAVGTLDAALASIRISTEELRAERAKYLQEDVKSREGARLRHRR